MIKDNWYNLFVPIAAKWLASGADDDDDNGNLRRSPSILGLTYLITLNLSSVQQVPDKTVIRPFFMRSICEAEGFDQSVHNHQSD